MVQGVETCTMHAYVLRNSHERIYLYSYMGYPNSFYMLLGVLVFSYINAERKRVNLRSDGNNFEYVKVIYISLFKGFKY